MIKEAMVTYATVGSKTHEFFLANGREFTAAPPPKDLAMGAMGRCYDNAARLALEDRTLSYVEGYAMKPALLEGYPFEHAWCVDRDGTVVDPTWADAGECCFWGVIVPTNDLSRELLQIKHYGVLHTFMGFNVKLAERLTARKAAA